jgi:ribosome-associated translation inhibitor RaiA
MDVILEARETLEPELKTFTENRVKFSLKRLFWMVRKIKVRYSAVRESKTAFNQNCSIELYTFDNRQIEVNTTARDRRAALDLGLKKIYKHIQKAFHKSQKYGRISKNIYV